MIPMSPLGYLSAGLGAALVAVTIASGIAIKWFDAKAEAANARAEKAVEDRGKEEQSRKGFEAAATSCGESVNKLLASAVAQKKAFDAKLEASRRKTADAEATLDLILSSRRPEGMNECQATFKELDDEIDRRAHEIDDRHPDAS